MINKFKSYLSISSFILFFFITQLIYAEDSGNYSGDQILKKVIAKIETINTLTYRLEKQERIKNKLVDEILNIKLSIDPFKVYTRMNYPKDGLEILFDSEWEKKKVIVNTNSFPWVNLKFDPYGRMMRKGQHHTILDSGFNKLISSIIFQYQTYLEKDKEMLENKGDTVIDGRKCWILEFENEHFNFENYIVGEKEDLRKIANKFKISDYMILENNKDVNTYKDVEAGQVIKIPSSYSKKIILYIDQIELIPLRIEVYDAKGLFEQFEFKNVKINVAFKTNEFSEDFEDYGF